MFRAWHNLTFERDWLRQPLNLTLGSKEKLMAVLIEAISVVVRADELLKKFPGGWDAFKSIVPNQTLCADNEIVRVGFMSPQDVE